jgi:glycosyltransferase involved in cell wall biosynthesis
VRHVTDDDGLTLIVCALNAEERLETFVAPLWRSVQALGAPAELVVVDDGSTDRTAVVAAVLGARVIRHEVNRGLPAARNTAVLNARHRWLLFCDDDLELAPAALRELWEARRRDGCVVPEVRDRHGRLQNAVVLRWRLLEPKFDTRREPVDEPAYPMGACFLVPAAIVREVNGFDERLQLYYEDTNFGWMLRAHGRTVRMIRGVEAIHREHGGAPSAARRQQVYKARWLFLTVTLTGWRRVAVLALGLPRAGLESLRDRTMQPIRGYLGAVGRR